MSAAPAPTKPTTEVAQTNGQSLVDQVLDQTQRNLAKALRETAGRYSAAIDQAADHLEKSILISSGILKLRKLLTDDVMHAYVMPLMNSPLGFLSDRDPSKAREGKESKEYGVEIIRECVIAASLAGLRWTDNEFNVIAGRMMPVKNGWRRKVLELPGVTEADIVLGQAVAEGGVAKVRIAAWCRRDGQVIELQDFERKPGRVFTIPIKSAQWETPDTWKGKAERRAWKALYERILGVKTGILLADDLEEVETAAPAPEAAGTGASGEAAGKPVSKADELADRLSRSAPIEQPAPDRKAVMEMERQDAIESIQLGLSKGSTAADIERVRELVAKSRPLLGEEMFAFAMAGCEQKLQAIQQADKPTAPVAQPTAAGAQPATREAPVTGKKRWF